MALKSIFMTTLTALLSLKGISGNLGSACCEFEDEIIGFMRADGQDDISRLISVDGKGPKTSTLDSCKTLCCERGCLSFSWDSLTKECHISSTKETNTSKLVAKPSATYMYRLGCLFQDSVQGMYWKAGDYDITERIDKLTKGQAAVTNIDDCRNLCCRWNCASLEFTTSTKKCRLSSKAPYNNSALTQNADKIFQRLRLQAVDTTPQRCIVNTVDNARCMFRDALPGVFQQGNNDISDQFARHPQVKNIQECQELCCEHGCLSFDYNNISKECRLSSTRACTSNDCNTGGGMLVSKNGEFYQEKLPCFFQQPKYNMYQPQLNDITDAFVTGHPTVESLKECQDLCCAWSCLSFEYTPNSGACRLSSFRANGKGGGGLKKASDGTMYVEIILSQPHTKCTFNDPKVGYFQVGSNGITDELGFHPKLKSIKECKEMCCEFGCLSFDFNTASGECRLSNTRAEQGDGGQLKQQANETYVERTACGFKKKQVGKFLPGNNDISDAFENDHPSVYSLEECQLLCCEHGCKSLEYTPSNDECRLSSVSASFLNVNLMTSQDEGEIYQEADNGNSGTCSFDDPKLQSKRTHVSKGNIASLKVANEALCRNSCCEKGCLSLAYDSNSQQCDLFNSRADSSALTNAPTGTYQEREYCQFHGVHKNKYWPGNNDITDTKAKFPNGHPFVTSIDDCRDLCCAWNCLSLEFTEKTGECRLSSKFATNPSQQLRDSPGEHYQMRDLSSHPCRVRQSDAGSAPKNNPNCGTANLDTGRCNYNDHIEGFVQQMQPFKILTSNNLRECRKLCCNNGCLSFNYDTIGKKCSLSDTRACRKEDGVDSAACIAGGGQLVRLTSNVYQEKIPCRFKTPQENAYMPGRNDISDYFVTGHPVVSSLAKCKELCCKWSCASLDYDSKSQRCMLSSYRASDIPNGGAATRTAEGTTYVETFASLPHQKCSFQNPKVGFYLDGRNDISDLFVGGHPKVTSLKDCQTLCCDHGCISFDYNQGKQECRLSSSRAGPNNENLVAQADETYVERVSCKFAAQKIGKYFPGNNDITDKFTNSHPAVRNIEECQQLCCEHNCKSLEFTTNTRECRLSSGIAGSNLVDGKYDVYQERITSDNNNGDGGNGDGGNGNGDGGNGNGDGGNGNGDGGNSNGNDGNGDGDGDADNTKNNNPANNGGGNPGGVAAGVIVTILVLGAAAVIIYFVVRSKKKGRVGSKYSQKDTSGYDTGDITENNDMEDIGTSDEEDEETFKEGTEEYSL